MMEVADGGAPASEVKFAAWDALHVDTGVLEDPGAVLLNSQILIAEGREAQAIANLRHALVVQPLFPAAAAALAVALVKQGQALIEQQRLDDAEAAFHEALRLRPTLAEAAPMAAALSYNRGVLAARAGRLDEAEHALRQALRIKPEMPEARQMLAAVLVRNAAQAERPMARLREALLLQPGQPDAVAALAIILHNRAADLCQQQQWHEAEAALRSTLMLRPDLTESRHGLAALLLRLATEHVHHGAFAKALASVREARSLQPDLAGADELQSAILRQLASDDARSGRMDLAEAKVRALLQGSEIPADLLPGLIEILTARASAELNAGNVASAAAICREVLAFSPDAAGARRVLAVARSNEGLDLAEAGHLDAAEAAFRDAVMLADDLASAMRDSLSRVLQVIAKKSRVTDDEDLTLSRWLEAAAASTSAEASIAAGWELTRRGLPDAGHVVISDALAMPNLDGDSGNGGPVLDALGTMSMQWRDVNGTADVFAQLASRTERRDICRTVIADHALSRGLAREAQALLAGHVSNWSRSFTVATAAEFRATGACADLAPTARRPSGRPRMERIAVSSLGTYGRFAHVVAEYVSMRLYAEKYGLVLETPDWCGQYLFEIDDPLYEGDLPLRNVECGILDDLTENRPCAIAGVDVHSPGPGCFRPEYRDFTMKTLRVRERWLPRLRPCVDALRSRGTTVVGIHLRRGDRVLLNDVAPEAIYIDWLRQNLPRLADPVVFLATDDLELKRQFAEFGAVTVDDLAPVWGENRYVQDFFVLMNADVVAISTGAFAHLAVALNDRTVARLRPNADKSRLEEFDPWRG